MSALIPPKQALAISKVGPYALFEDFKEAFTKVYNGKVKSRGFSFPMVIHLSDIAEYDRLVASVISVRIMQTMIKTIMSEYACDLTIQIIVEIEYDTEVGDEWIMIDVKECPL
jgi:hypothetical protein